MKSKGMKGGGESEAGIKKQQKLKVCEIFAQNANALSFYIYFILRECYHFNLWYGGYDILCWYLAFYGNIFFKIKQNKFTCKNITSWDQKRHYKIKEKLKINKYLNIKIKIK